MASQLMEKVTYYLQQNKHVIALRDRGEQWLAKSPKSVRAIGLRLLDTALMYMQRVVIAVLVLLGRDVQHPADKPTGFIGFVPFFVRLLRNAFYAMKLMRKWTGVAREEGTPKPLTAFRRRNMPPSQLHSTPKRLQMNGKTTTPPRTDVLSTSGAKANGSMHAATNGNANGSVNGSAKKQSAPAEDAPDNANDTSVAGLSSLAGWLFNGISGYIDDNDVDDDVDNNEADKTSGDESQEFRSVTDSDEDEAPVTSQRSPAPADDIFHLEQPTKANGHI